MANEFSKYIYGENISFKHALGASDRSGKEFHPFYEIVLFLGGQAEFYTDGFHAKPLPGSLLLIPKETFHQLNITGAQSEYHRCVFNFYTDGDTEELTLRCFEKSDLIYANENIRMLFDMIINTADKSENRGKAIIKSALILILNEILATNNEVIERRKNNSETLRTVEYIGTHLSETLTVESIAKVLNISPSSLAHTFKREMNISIYQYILKKRLVTAYERIKRGEKSTLAAIESGFSDYSGFYRQYKKMFGISPSKKDD